MSPDLTWHDKFMQMAELIASWSKDPSTQVGCVIVDDDHNVRAIGYNGFPRGVKDDNRLHDRPIKHRMIVHAEANAVAAAARTGVPLAGCTAYVTAPVCGQCAALLIQAGIKRVIASPAEMKPEWTVSVAVGAEMLVEGGVSYFWGGTERHREEA